MLSRPDEETEKIKPAKVVYLSVEGNKTEIQYFSFVDMFKAYLRINSIIKIQVIRRNDTKSDIDSVYGLLEDFVALIDKGDSADILHLLIPECDIELIRQYLDSPDTLDERSKARFEKFLDKNRFDLEYIRFICNHEEDDIFCIVLDRDSKSHSVDALSELKKKCDAKSYRLFLTAPCFELFLLLHIAEVDPSDEDFEKIRTNPTVSSKHTYLSKKISELTGQNKKISKDAFKQYYKPNIAVALQRLKKFAITVPELIDDSHAIGSNMEELFELLRK